MGTGWLVSPQICGICCHLSCTQILWSSPIWLGDTEVHGGSFFLSSLLLRT